ncbi:MAG: TonB-dependent receptor [Desulfobacterales bacterium]|nr:MAG: TonB-dependent receptor [Desulfobacterales bacterium]
MSDMELQFYYDREERSTFYVNTVDVDFQHRFMPLERHEIIWGLGYRYVDDKFEEAFSFSFEPDSRDTDLFSAFIQDEITLFPDRLRLTVGSKFEHNDFTGFEIQPNARILWTPAENHSVWAAVSRAIRTPSQGEEDARIINGVVLPDTLFPGSPVAFVRLIGSDDFESEELIAYEAGYRFRPIDRLSVDIAGFYNDYDNLRTIEPIGPFTFAADNKMEGETYGVELAADWRPFDWWRLQAAYTYLQMELKLDADSGDSQSERAEDEIPHHQASLRSSLELPANLEMDLWLRYVDELPAQNVDDYVTPDVRVGWKPIKNLEVSLVGQNLLENHHPEFRPEILDTPAAEIERSVYGKITWRF